MDTKKLLKCIKQAAQSFSIVAGAISALFAVISVFAVVPALISLPIATGIGLVYGVITGMQTANEHDIRQASSKNAEKERCEAIREVHEMKMELDEIKLGFLQSPKAPGCDSKAIFAGLNTKPANDGVFVEPEMEKTAEIVVPIHPLFRQKSAEKKEPAAAASAAAKAANQAAFYEPERTTLGMH